MSRRAPATILSTEPPVASYRLQFCSSTIGKYIFPTTSNGRWSSTSDEYRVNENTHSPPSFCRQYGIRFPQATIRQTVLSVAAPSQDIPSALHTVGASMTRRFDGGDTLVISGRGRVDITPQLLGFSAQFLPMFQRRWRNLAPGGLEGWRAGHESLKRWRLDQPTPMERMRILDPSADTSAVALTYKRAVELVPAFQGASIKAAWPVMWTVLRTVFLVSAKWPACQGW